MMKEGFP